MHKQNFKIFDTTPPQTLPEFVVSVIALYLYNKKKLTAKLAFNTGEGEALPK